ncbi:unnamed protein product [Moneuplotes crassus]|uniref:Uncharacterized protein n=1 Tax=Euplotes crassus TaxID=5936 RepID=A0AAD1XDG7_EUPCR|nr:unnamed protein product [Moneuplotes crassus]
MYNVYTFEKKIHETQSKDSLKREMYKTNSFRDKKFVKRREDLAIRYRQRMTDFISKISDRTLIQNHPYTVESSLDQGKSMRSTFRTEKERINASVENNSIFDSTPSPNLEKSFQLRPRQPEKEIGDPKFRHQPKTTIERVMDAIQKNALLDADYKQKQTLSVSPIRGFRNRAPHYSSVITAKGSKKSSSRQTSHISIKAKNLLPHLHEKTHYKAATTFTLSHPQNFYCPRSNSGKNQKEIISQKVLYSAFKNIEGKHRAITSQYGQQTDYTPNARIPTEASDGIDAGNINISDITREVLRKNYIFRQKSQEIRNATIAKSKLLQKRVMTKARLDSNIPKKMLFRDHIDAYSPKKKVKKLKRNNSSKPICVEIDEKFLSSSSDGSNHSPTAHGGAKLTGKSTKKVKVPVIHKFNDKDESNFSIKL